MRLKKKEVYREGSREKENARMGGEIRKTCIL